MPESVHFAVDCGASSGRVIAGFYDAEARRCRMEEVHRFANGGEFRGETFYWNWEALLDGICDGLAKGLKEFPDAASIGVDTWGVDFGLLDAEGTLIEDPVHHRDERGARAEALLDAVMDERERFRASGIRQMSINTLNQLVAVKAERPELLERAARLLNMPDLINHALTGVAKNERSIASTTSCAVPGAAEWHAGIIETFGLPKGIFGELVTSGTVLGPLDAAMAARLGVGTDAPVRVVASAGHDTADAVAAVPSTGDAPCYISSGTWSLMGTIRDEPVLGDTCFARKLSNETCWDGRIRLLENIVGLWVIQECQRQWKESGEERSFAELAAMAREAPSPGRALDVNDARFLGPGTDADPMPDRVRAWYREQGLPVPESTAAVSRAVHQGLAEAYASCMQGLQELTGEAYGTVHVIGGGSRNAFLCQLTADRCGVPVLAGPDEATALGNILIQACGLGLLAKEDFAEVVINSSGVERYVPEAP